MATGTQGGAVLCGCRDGGSVRIAQSGYCSRVLLCVEALRWGAVRPAHTRARRRDRRVKGCDRSVVPEVLAVTHASCAGKLRLTRLQASGEAATGNLVSTLRKQGDAARRRAAAGNLVSTRPKHDDATRRRVATGNLVSTRASTWLCHGDPAVAPLEPQARGNLATALSRLAQ